MPTMHYLTRRFAFSASHKLESPKLDDDEEREIYGMCRNIHGHNYRLEVTVRGEPDRRTGFFANVMALHQVVQARVVDLCEHQFLNDLPIFRGTITTMEGLASRIWELIEPPLAEGGMQLHEVLVAETDDNVVRLRKD